MRRIVVSIQNRLLSEAICETLREDGKFETFEILQEHMDKTADECELLRPEILLMEVTYGYEATLEKRLEPGHRVREILPDCKIVLLCDDNSSPSIANSVKEARYKGFIDAFFYASVSSAYLKAVLESL